MANVTIEDMLDFYEIPNFGVAGLAHPGNITTLKLLQAGGYNGLVSLSETPMARRVISYTGMRYIHIPVIDFTAPSMRDIDRFVDFVSRCHAERINVAVHCHAGQGRTGTMLACWLVAMGFIPSKAVDHVREYKTLAIETADQVNCVYRYYTRKTGKVDKTSPPIRTRIGFRSKYDDIYRSSWIS